MKQLILLLFCTVTLVLNADDHKHGGDVAPIKIDDKLTLLMGDGGNSGILEGDNAILVIDTKMAGGVDKLWNLVQSKLGNKQLIVINTHYHMDHISGNSKYKGARIIAGGYEKTDWVAANGEANLPTEFLKDSLTLKIGDEEVLIVNIGQAHTRGDVFVYLNKHKILFGGDVIVNKVHPVFIKEMGADTRLYIKKINEFLANHEVKNIVPGHGAYGEVSIAKAFTDYLANLVLAAKNKQVGEEIKMQYKDWYDVAPYSSMDKSIEFVKKEIEVK